SAKKAPPPSGLDRFGQAKVSVEPPANRVPLELRIWVRCRPMVQTPAFKATVCSFPIPQAGGECIEISGGQGVVLRHQSDLLLIKVASVRWSFDVCSERLKLAVRIIPDD